MRRQAPTLVAAIDRAAALCEDALRFARADEPELRLTRFGLASLVDDVRAAVVPTLGSALVWRNEVGEDVSLRADRDQIFRVLLNLARNAAEAMPAAGEIRVSTEPSVGMVTILIADSGTGLPSKARQNLFQAFAGGARPGGTGLDLAIARELMLGHGGELALVTTGATGTVFRITLPQGPAQSS